MASTGRAGEPPTPAGAAVVDQHGAALLAMGILGALVQRERTGEGQKIEVTMVQAALDLLLEPATYHLNGAPLARPHHTIADTFHAAPYGVYRTADGYLALSMTPISTLSEALGGVPELDALRGPDLAMPQREEIAEILRPILRTRTTGEWMATLREQGVWCAPVNGYDEVFAEPAVQFLDPILEIDHPEAGHVRLLKHPIRYGAGEPEVRHLPPAIGEHTEDVLREAGYSRTRSSNCAPPGRFEQASETSPLPRPDTKRLPLPSVTPSEWRTRSGSGRGSPCFGLARSMQRPSRRRRGRGERHAVRRRARVNVEDHRMNRWQRIASLVTLSVVVGWGVGSQGTIAQDATDSHPAHIHSGSCAQLGDVVYPLTNVSASGMMTGMIVDGRHPQHRHAGGDGHAGRADDEPGDGGGVGHCGRDEPDPRRRHPG